MTLADGEKSRDKEQQWEDEDVDLTAAGSVGQDLVIELKLSPDECQEELQFILFRGDLPMPSDRYQIHTRGNVVQLTLKESQKDDAGHYALVARKLSTGLSIPGDERVESRRKIRLSIHDPSQGIDEGEPPIFVRRLSDLAVKVGTRTRFLVEIRSSTSPKVTWHKNDEPVQSGSRFSFVHEGNFYCVDVAPVMVDDQGHWTCMAENGGGRSSCTSFLNVIVPKAYKKPEFVEELRALLTETGTVSLECKVVGVPTPVLKWFKDQKEIKAGDVFALTANPDDPTSLGTYTCEAVNCMGTACSSSRVHVVGKGSREGSLKPADALTPSGPLPVFKKILRDESCRIGDSLTLSCQVTVPPWPKTITWYNKEGRVEPSEKYHVIADGLGGYSIEIKSVEAMDEGEWKCVATSFENMKQFSTCYVAMSIPKNYRVPRFMESLKAVLTEEGLVSFECKVVGFPTPLLRWFKDGQELHPGDVYQLTGTNSLGSYCCIARNCMGETKSTAELTVEDIQNQLNEEERMQLMSSNQAPKFVKGLRSCEARINEDFTFTIQVSVSPEPSLSWYRDDVPIIESEKYRLAREVLGACHLEVRKLEFVDQAEWKCVAANDFGHSVTSCFLKLVIPKHFKKPKFLESLRAILSEEGAVNLECKVIGVPQPVLKWYKDGVELKPGDIHRIISGQDGTCCLGTYTCEATNCMGSISSSASLLGFEDRVSVRKEEAKEPVPLHELARNLSLSTIHEERTSQMYDTPQTDHSITLDDRGEVSFSFDGKEVSVSLYETPDLTEEEALQIVEMYADQLSEHITEGNVIELPPMRFTKETSTTGNLLMEAVVIDVSPDYFIPDEEADDLRTEADVEDVSIMDDQMQSIRSSSYVSSPIAESPGDRVPSGSPPSRPPRRKESRESVSSRSERSDKSLPKGFDWSESYHSAKEPSMQAQSSLQGHDDSGEAFTDALSSSGAGRSKAEESKDLYASFVEQTVEKIPFDETIDLSREEINDEDPIATQIADALVQEIPAKRKKKKKDKITKGSRTPSLSSKASSEESYSVEPEEKVKRRGSKGAKEKRDRRGSAKDKEDRRGSVSSNKSAGRDRRSRSNSENDKFESAASTERRRRESDATIVVEDVRIEQMGQIGEIKTTNNVESTHTKADTDLEERPASAASMASTIGSEKSMSKTNKERLLENVYKLSEPILVLRNALVDLDSLLPLLQTDGTPADVERSQMEIAQRIVEPVENLCEQVSAIENKALKSAGDRSLAQNVRISLLEAVGGPTEELLRGVELIRRHSDQPQDPKAHLIVLESLTDPVDEILVGLTKIEHELTSPESEMSLVSLEKPIALERMCRAVSRLGTNIGMISERKLTFGDESTRCSVIERLQSVYQSLEAFLSTIPLSDVSGALENNVDTLVVETLVRPLEELSRKLHIFSTADVQTQIEQDNVVAGLEKSMSEMRTRLEALTIALETYEKESGEQGITELHADLVKFLRYTMDDAVERLEKLKLNKKRVTQEVKAEETAAVTPMIFDGKSRQDSDMEELAVESNVESSEPEESNVLKDLAAETAEIMKKVTVPSIVESEMSETGSQLMQEKSRLSKTAEKSSTDAEEEPPVKKDRKKKQKKDLSREESGEASSSPKTKSHVPPELDQDLSLPEMLLDPLIDVQANLSDVISDFESQESAEESSLPGTSELAACLTELRECVATAAHTAQTLKSANTVNALVDLREPLLDLQLAMASAVSPEEAKLIQEATVPLAELKVIVAAAIRSPQASEASQVQMKPVLRMLEDIEAEVAKVSQQKATPQVAVASPAVSEPTETRSVPKRPPEEVERAAVALTGVHFALSTALERVSPFAAESPDSLSLSSQQGIQAAAQKTAELSAASNLISSIEELRQCVGTLAVAIGTPVTSTEGNNQYSYDILFDELAKLEEPLLNLQKVLLTEAHGPEDRHVLNDVASPIRSLKEVVQDVTRDIGGGSTPIVLELIEDVEKDVSLIAMEALKKALAGKSETSDTDEGRASVSSDLKPGEVPGIILKWLDPIEDWLTSTAEEVGEVEYARGKSSIAPAVDDLKRELLKIAIQTSYSEPPSDVALIESLTELQEPLSKVCQVLAECHEPENLDIVEGLIQPTKHLLGTILDASMTHEAGKVLRPVLEAIEELENQIPLTIQRATYERELQRVVRSMTPEEPATLMADDMPETLEEATGVMDMRAGEKIRESFEESSSKIATAASEVDVMMEESVQALSKEDSAALEASAKSSKAVESRKERAQGTEVAVQEIKSTEKLESTSKISTAVKESEKTAEEIARITSLEDSGLQAELGSLETLGSAEERVQPIEVTEEKGTSKEKAKLSRQVATGDSQLEEMVEGNAQVLPEDHSESLLTKAGSSKMEELKELAEAKIIAVEEDKLKENKEMTQKTEIANISEVEKPITQLLNKEDIALAQAKAKKSEVPTEHAEVSVEQDKSKEKLQTSSKIATAASELEVMAQEKTQVLSQQDSASLQAQATSFESEQSNLETMAKTTEAAVLQNKTKSELESTEENVSQAGAEVLKTEKTEEQSGSSKDVGNQGQSKRQADNLVHSDTIELITVDSRPFVEEVTSLQPQQATETTLVDTNRAEQLDLWTLTLLGPLDRLGNAVLSLDRSLGEEAHGLLCRPLDSLHKQIESAESQFNRLAGQSLENDVETIIEGFLSPVNQLHEALSSAVAIWDVEEPEPVVNHLLRAMADSSTELCELLDALRKKLVLERSQTRQEQQEDASLVETITAVLAPLDDLRHLIESTLKSTKFMALAMKSTEDSVPKDRHHEIVESAAEEQAIVNEEEKVLEQTDLATRSREQKAQGHEEMELSTASVSKTETVAAAAKGDILDKDVKLTELEKAAGVVEPTLEEKVASSKPEVAKGLKKGGKGKEESMDIEEKTAKPLEELIEAIVDSSGPRPVSSSPEGYQSISPDVSDDNIDKTDLFVSESTDNVPDERVKELGVQQSAEIASTDNIAAEKLEDIGADKQEKHKAKVVTKDNVEEAGKAEGVMVSKSAQQVVTEDVAKSSKAGISEMSQIDAEEQALKKAEASEVHLQEESLEEAGSKELQKKKANLVTEESLAKAEGRKQESLVLESSSASQENVSSEDVEEMVTEELKKQKAECRDTESAGKVGVTNAPEIKVRSLEAEVSETSEVLEEGVQEISKDKLEKQKAELREGEGLAKADVKEAPQTRLKATETSEAQEGLQEGLQELSTEEMQKQQVELRQGESLATASVTDAPEMKIKARDPEISEISTLPEESAEEIDIMELDDQKAKLQEGEGFAIANVMEAPETKIKSMEAQVLETSEHPEEGVEEMVSGKLDKQTAELCEAENLAKAGVAEAPETKIKPRDAQVSETSELPEEGVEEMAAGNLHKQKAKIGETEDLAKAGVTEAPETKIKTRDAQILETSEVPEEGVEKMATDKLDKQKAEIGDAEDLAKAGVAEAPETKVKPREAQVSETSVVSEEGVEEMAAGELIKQKAKISETENLAKAGVIDAPETKIKPRDAQVSETSEVPEEGVEEMAAGKLDKQTANIGETENLAKAGVTDAPETKIKPRDAQVSETSEVPEEGVEEMATGKSDKQKAKISEAENLAKAGVTDAPETKIKPRDAQVSETSEVPEQGVEEMATGKSHEQTAKMSEAENLAKAGVTAAPETKIKPRNAQVSETSEVPEEGVEEMATGKSDKQKAKISEAENLAKAGVTDAPETKVKAIDATVSETSDLPEEHVEEIVSGVSDKKKAELREAEGLIQAGVTDAPEVKIKAREAQVSETLQHPEETVSEIVDQKLEKQAAISESESLTKVKVSDAPETKVKSGDLQKSGKSTVLQKAIQEIKQSGLQIEAQKAIISVMERQIAQIAKVEAEEVAKFTKEETIEAAESTIVEVVDTPTQKIFKMKKEGTKNGEPDEIVEKIIVKPVEEVVAMEDQNIVETIETPTEKVIKMKVAVERTDGVVEEVVEEIVVKKPAEGWTKTLVEEERGAVSVSDVRVQELIAGKSSSGTSADLAIEEQQQSVSKVSKKDSEVKADEEAEQKSEKSRKEEDKKDAKSKNQEKERLRQEESDKRQEQENKEDEQRKREGSERLNKEQNEKLLEAEKLEKEELDRQEKAKQEAERLEHEEAERLKREEAERVKREEAERLKREEAERVKREEAERVKREEAERLEREEAERVKREEAERLEREEAERVKREEAERVKREEAERVKREEAERVKREEAERVKREETERVKREEAERLEREEAERVKREEAERVKREEAERVKREEAERLEREEAERLKREEAERLKREEAERLKREEAERLKREEAERLKREEAERLEREEVERKKKEEEERLRKEEAARLETEERERQEKLEAERLKKEEEEKLRKEEAERLEKEERERQEKLEAERLKKEEEERLRKEEAEKLEMEERERAKKEEEERLKKEEAARMKKEELERAKKEEEERLKKDEADRLKKEELERAKKDEEERLKKEEADRLKKEELERAKKDEEERLKKEEAERVKKEEEERLKKEDAIKIEKEKREKEESAKLEKEKREKEEAAKLEKEKREKEEAAKLEKEKREKEEAAKLEKEKLEKEEAAKLEKEKLEKEKAAKLEKEKLEKEKAAKLEKEKLEKEKAAKLEEEKLEKEKAAKLEKEKLEKEEAAKLEKEKLEKEKAAKLEKEKLEKEEAAKLENEKLEKEKAAKLKKEELEKEEAAKLEKEKLEKEKAAKLEKEKLEKEKAAKLEKEKLEKEKAAKLEEEKLEKEKAAKLEKEKLEKEEAAKLEKEKLEKEKAAKLEKEQFEKEEAAKLEKEKLEKEKAAKLEKEKLEKEEAAKLEKEKLEKEKADKLEKEKLEKEEAAKLEKEKLEKEEAAKLEKQKLEKEEAAKLEKEKEEAAKLETEKLSKQKEESERLQKKERKRSEKKEAERLKKEEEDRRKTEEEGERRKTEEKLKNDKVQLETEEAERLKNEKLERQQKEVAERLKEEEQERRQKEEVEAAEKESLLQQEQADAERLKKKELKRQQKEEAKRSKTEDSKEETRRSSKKAKDQKTLPKEPEDQPQAVSSTKLGDEDDDKTPVNSEHEITDHKRNKRHVQGHEDPEIDRDPRSTSTIRTDSEMESEHSESSRSAISRDAAIPSRRRRSGQQMAIEVDHEVSKDRSDRRGSDRPILNRMRDDTLSSDDRHYTPHYSATSRSHDFTPGPRDRGKKPSFCTKLTDRTAAEASRIKLTCTVLGDPEPQIYWTKDGVKLPNSSNRHCVNEENGMISLEFYGALPKDSGEYSCVAKNVHGQAHTEAKLKVYAGYEPSPAVPTFTRSIKDTYHSAENELVLECRVRGQPSPKITWLKDGQTLQIGDRYQQCDLGDGLCRLKISNPDFYDSGLYTCKAENNAKISDRTSHVVNFEGKGKEHGWRGSYRNLTSTEIDTGRPRFSSYLTDHSVPAGGTIALQVEVKGVPPPDITWMRGDRREPIPSYKARTFADSGVYTLIVPEATESETGTYVCRASNAYGYVDTTANVQVVSSSCSDGGKPAMFISRPAETMIYVTVGEDVSVSFRVNGVPKPRIVWMKGMRDITNGPRSYKESIDDYVRLTLKRALVSDEGTYCILAKNRYGCDRTFYTVKVKQRARSLTPSPDWGSVDTDNLLANIHDTERSYLKQVPGPITSEPVVVDGGRNWLALSWGKAVQHGPAPVVAYRVDAWLLGGEGGARWSELGITPVNAYDAFNLRPGGEYKFRITPRNRYGWGEAVTMTNSVTVREVVKFPEFSKILPGQLKALRGETLHLECEVRSESKAEVKWYRDTTDIDALEDPRYMTYFNGSKSTVTVQSIKEHDSGRYVCEATNPAGRVSTFARVQVVTDPKIVEADEKLRRMRTLEPNNEERPPEFTMRLRDRRVQMTYPVRLTCQVSGHPEPDVQWYKDREEIFQDENVSFWDDESHFHTLEISHSTIEDSGIYMARARNVNGSVSCRCHLVVDKGIRAYVAPEFFRHLDAVYTVKAGGELRMTAQIEAYPTVGIVWHRDGHRLRPSRSAVMTLNHDGSVELSLAYVTPRDAGLYCCTATNEVGQAESTTRVTVLGAADEEPSSLTQSLPDVVESLDVPYSKEPLFVTKPLSTEAVEGDTVIILCEVVGDPKPEVIWLRDFLRPDYYRDAAHFRRVGAGPQYRLEIPYAKLDFTGAYSVIAKNCHGEAKAIISLQIYARGQGKTDSSMEQATIKHGNVQTLPSIKRPLRDLRCCDGDAITLICRVHATPEPDVRWEKGGKLVALGEDFAADFDGETARLSIQHVYPEDEGEYTCVAYNDLGKAFTSACLIVDVPEGKESALSRRLIRPVGLLSAESTPISTPRSTPVRSLSPSCRRELKPAARTPRGQMISRRPRLPTGPKFYAVPHNRVAEEGETVRFQCAVAGHPAPWVTWDKDGVSVTPTARISLKEKDDVRILEIAEITHEDAGLYRITLENDVGRTEATARLEIIKGRQGSVTRSIRTRSASPRTYSIYSRSPITSAIRGDTHLRPNIYEPMGGRGGTLSPTLPRWHHRNGKLPIESPEPVRRMNKRTSAPARTPLKNGVAPKDQNPSPKSQTLKIPTKPRSSSVPNQNQNPKDVHLTNISRQTKTSIAQRSTNEAKIRSNNNSKTTTAPTTNGSMIPKRLPISRSRSPKISAQISSPPRKSIDSVDFSESMTVPVLEIHDETLPAAEKKENDKSAAPLSCHEDILEAKIPPLVTISPPMKCHKILREEPHNVVQETKEPRAPVILAAPADVVALRGAKVILLATFDGEPQPRVRWLRRGRDVKLDDKAEIETSRGLTCLTLEGVTTEQAGKYAVTLENATGRDCRYVNVTVEGVPDPPAGTPCVQSITRAGKAIVTWRSPPYDGGCAVTGYNVEMKRGEEPCWVAVAEARHSLSHTVTGLEPEETYRFRVRAENAHGVSEPSTVSDAVTVPGEHDEEIGGQVFVAEINQIEIEEEEEEFEPAFEARIVSPEEGCYFEARYEIKEELGKGRYGIVRRIVEKSSGLNLAAKFVRTIKAKDRQQVHEEIGIMNMLRHPKLLRLAAAFESPKEMIMVTEYISGGELFERVVADDFTLTEKDSIQFVKQICEGVEYMHTHCVVHLDLKPENIMCHTRTSHRIKLIDFGLAQILKPDTPVRVLFGTPEFIPPEIIGFEPIGTESDMWSVGVICYVLLTGLSPFMGDNDAETFANITRADFDFDDKAFTAISQEAKDFISALLIKRKELRMSAKQCLEHAWLAQRAESMSRVALPTDKLKKFIVRRKWQKTGNAIRALGRMAILSANSRRNHSAGSSPTKTEFGEELFADVTTNPHGFKPIQPIVVVEDRTAEDFQEKPEEIVEEFVKPIVKVVDKTGEYGQKKPEDIVEELKPIVKFEDRTEENNPVNPEEIDEKLVESIVEIEDRTGESCQEKPEEVSEELKPIVEIGNRTGENYQDEPEEVAENLKPIVEVEDRSEGNYQESPEEIDEEEEKSDEPEVDKLKSIPEDNLNTKNYTNGLHIEESFSTLTELETTQISDEEELQDSKPLIQEIDDLIRIEANKKTVHSATEVCIEELSNETCAESEISTDFECETTSNFKETTRKLSFSSFVNLEITETGKIEISGSSEPEECLRIEESDESIGYETKEEEDAEEKEKEANLISNEEISDKHDDEAQQVNEKTPVVTKAWCKNNNPVSVDEEDEDARLMGRVRTRHIVCTGSVSRTAKMFEKEEEANSVSQKQQNPVSRSVPMVPEVRPQNERIRKAFAFWNK